MRISSNGLVRRAIRWGRSANDGGINLRNKPSVLVPREHRHELAKLSKAALMDMVWHYAMSRRVGPQEPSRPATQSWPSFRLAGRSCAATERTDAPRMVLRGHAALN